MIAVMGRPCPECGTSTPLDGLRCETCGAGLLHRPIALLVRHERRWPWLVLGAALAPAFAVAPLLQYMGWFFGSLVHETGHAAVAWLFGCPAIPAIRLDGHAAAVHGSQVLFLCLIVMGLLGLGAWRCTRRWLALGAVALYPLFAFTGAREFLFLISGHLAEIGFATFLLARALDGGFSGARAERALHATMGFFLAGRNVWLAGGLLFDAGVRRWYAGSGSFGLTNDLLRIAREIFHASTDGIAALLLLASLAVLPVALWLARD